MKLSEQIQGSLSLRTARKTQPWKLAAVSLLQQWKGFWSEEWAAVSHRRLVLASASAVVFLTGTVYLGIQHLSDTTSWTKVFTAGTYQGMVPTTNSVIDPMKRTAVGYNVDLQLEPVHLHMASGYDWKTIASLPMSAASINLNGHPLVYTTDASAAAAVLDTVKQALTPKGVKPDAKVGFVGDVSVTPVQVSVTDVLQPDTAVRMLLSRGSGTLAGRSGAVLPFGVSNNPDSSGLDSLSATPALQVQVQEQVTKDVPIPYSVKYVDDNELGKGAISVVTPGANGLAKEQEVLSYVDGKLVSTTVLSKTTVKEPRTEVAKRGTNPGIAEGSWGWPSASYTVTSGYGWRNLAGYGDFHPGIDIGCPIGTPIYATNNGVVEDAGWNSGGYGIWVKINNGRGIETIFGHMSRTAVHAGQTVAKGEVIGYSGETGMATGPHVHYEVRIDGQHVDPRPYM